QRGSGDDMALSPARTIDVEPNVDGVVTDLDEVVQAVAVDVVDAEGAALDVGVEGTRAHLEVAIARESLAGAVVAEAGGPNAVAAAGPISDVTAAHAHDVLDAVAVHVGEVDVAVAEVDGRAACGDAGAHGIVGDLRGDGAGADGAAELAVAVRV